MIEYPGGALGAASCHEESLSRLAGPAPTGSPSSTAAARVLHVFLRARFHSLSSPRRVRGRSSRTSRMGVLTLASCIVIIVQKELAWSLALRFLSSPTRVRNRLSLGLGLSCGLALGDVSGGGRVIWNVRDSICILHQNLFSRTYHGPRIRNRHLGGAGSFFLRVTRRAINTASPQPVEPS